MSPARRFLLLLDFDGTLVPLAARPELARLPAATRLVLSRLSARPGVRVAIVSGRSLPDLRRRVGLRGIVYVGNHGLEIQGPGLRLRRPGPSRAALSKVERALALSGGVVEHKGLTLSLHYRGLRGARLAAFAAALPGIRAEVRAAGLRLKRGKKVWEVLPKAAWGKGHAAVWLLRRLGGSPIAVGDDQTDEDMFRAVGRKGLTVKVGPGPTRARARLRGPRDVVSFLDGLAGA